MKNKIIISLSIIIALVSLIALPIDTKAKTIKEFEAEVNKYTQELEEKRASLAKNDAEVAEIKSKIAATQAEITKAQEEIARLQEEIEKSEEEIKTKSEESKNIISYYQISNGENAYLEYAFGAEDITDMVYRLSIVEQLTEYNDKIMKELEQLIKTNQAKQAELTQKQEELKVLEQNLKAEKAKIEIESNSIKEAMPSIQDQINSARDSVNYYKKLGCGATEDVQQCEYRISQASSSSSLPSVGFFSRPMDNGYVVRGKYPGHLGYDFSSSNKFIAIHPIAPGVVHAIYTDSCTSEYWCSNMGFSCNGNAKIVVVKHNYNGGYLYSSYVHLSSYGNVSVGSVVSRDTIIGYMGTSGCSTGNHLHLEIATCHWKKGGCATYGAYERSVVNPANYINIPSSWNNR